VTQTKHSHYTPYLNLGLQVRPYDKILKVVNFIDNESSSQNYICNLTCEIILLHAFGQLLGSAVGASVSEGVGASVSGGVGAAVVTAGGSVVAFAIIVGPFVVGGFPV
jgi:hypothetical protein